MFVGFFNVYYKQKGTHTLRLTLDTNRILNVPTYKQIRFRADLETELVRDSGTARN